VITSKERIAGPFYWVRAARIDYSPQMVGIHIFHMSEVRLLEWVPVIDVVCRTFWMNVFLVKAI